MKKKFFVLLLALVVVFTFTACAGKQGTKPNSGETPEKFELIGGINLPTEHPYYLGMARFAELMEEKSGGRITMTIHPNAQLGNERDVVEALQLGSVDVTLISAAPLSNFTSDFQVFDFPYIFYNREHAYAVLDSEIGRTILDGLEQHKLIGLEFLENGFYWITSNKPIKKPADMARIKIRSLENQMQVDGYNVLGANAIAMAFSEVFTSLQNGTLHAAGLTPSVIGSQKMYTVNDYVSKTNHYYAAAPLLFSKATFDKMSPDLQQIVREAAAEARDYQREQSALFDQTKIEEMREYGTTFIEVDKQEWIDSMVPPIYEKYVGKGKLIDPVIYDQIKAMEADYK